MDRRHFVGTVFAAAGVAGGLLALPALAVTFYRPDFCFGNPCRIELGDDNAFVAFTGKCSAHTSIQTINTLSDSQLYDAILQSSRRKEVARWGVKLFKGLDEDAQFTVDADGTIHVISGLNGKQKDELAAQVQMSIVGVSAPAGTVSIVVD